MGGGQAGRQAGRRARSERLVGLAAAAGAERARGRAAGASSAGAARARDFDAGVPDAPRPRAPVAGRQMSRVMSGGSSRPVAGAAGGRCGGLRGGARAARASLGRFEKRSVAFSSAKAPEPLGPSATPQQPPVPQTPPFPDPSPTSLSTRWTYLPHTHVTATRDGAELPLWCSPSSTSFSARPAARRTGEPRPRCARARARSSHPGGQVRLSASLGRRRGPAVLWRAARAEQRARSPSSQAKRQRRPRARPPRPRGPISASPGVPQDHRKGPGAAARFAAADARAFPRLPLNPVQAALSPLYQRPYRSQPPPPNACVCLAPTPVPHVEPHTPSLLPWDCRP